MDHQSFRFYIPGIVFLVPIYFVICWITVNYYSDAEVRTFVLVGGITTFPVISLPVGWWIYNAYRVWWLLFTKGGYENKAFVKMIRKETKPFYSPVNQSILIDFSHIRRIESWISIDLDTFRRTFYPYTSKKSYYRQIERDGIVPKFTEPLSDFIMFQDEGYDYARSISSVRYGLESSVFALGLSIPFAYGIRYIWLCNLNNISDKTYLTFWIVLLSLIVGTLLLTLFVRWKIADKEYDARLLLTTLTSIKSNYYNRDNFQNNIPKEIAGQLINLKPKGNEVAAFDLDNTLLIGDIGEAVFALLILKGIVTDFSWHDYQNLISKNRNDAYKKVIEVMNGLNVNELRDITREVINSQDTEIEIEGIKVPIPRPNPIMQSIISLIKSLGIDTFVITASNEISAEIICWEYFGIPSNKVFGAKLRLRHNFIVGVSEEIPFGMGKVNVLKSLIQKIPIISAGDNEWDLLLLDYTSTHGFRFWLGKDSAEYAKIKAQKYSGVNFYHL